MLSDNPDVALKDVMGKMVTVELVRDAGSQRYFNGCCLRCSHYNSPVLTRMRSYRPKSLSP
ncbi:hypothetical protein MAFF211271_45560 (plasmid) [Ralstonia syzygii subsp. indonesiensis]|nr:hypothetical protein MAFF211271_45560 [Ralstonia pseudosolanacearum]